MTTNKLRRDLEVLKKRGGRSDCPGCGYPSYANVEYKIKMNVTPVGDPPKEPEPPEHCDICGRQKRNLVVRMRGLNEKPRGEAVQTK
jgi:hypothetical protein